MSDEQPEPLTFERSHVHSFSVDIECDGCGKMLSEVAQTLRADQKFAIAELSSLRAENERLRKEVAFGDEDDERKVAGIKALTAENERLRREVERLIR